MQPFAKPLGLSFITSRYPSATFGEFIRKARLEKGLKQMDVTEMIGVDVMTLSNGERISGVLSRSKKVLAPCEALGLDYSSLVGRFLIDPFEETRFGRTLLGARVKLGFTQEEAASKAGIDPGTLARWERCAKPSPSWMHHKLVRLQMVLGIEAL
jgi:transcriptional regulator with XRE-family HTH domain